MKKTSKHRGVSWHKDKGKWQVQIGVNGKNNIVGHFDDELDAARAYDVQTRLLGRAVNFKAAAADLTVQEEQAARPPYHGITFDKKSGKWQARMKDNGKEMYFGLHDTPEDAAHAWDAEAVKRGRTDLNFPQAAGGASGSECELEDDDDDFDDDDDESDDPDIEMLDRTAAQQEPAAASIESPTMCDVAVQTEETAAGVAARVSAAHATAAALQMELRALKAEVRAAEEEAREAKTEGTGLLA